MQRNTQERKEEEKKREEAEAQNPCRVNGFRKELAGVVHLKMVLFVEGGVWCAYSFAAVVNDVVQTAANIITREYIALCDDHT